MRLYPVVIFTHGGGWVLGGFNTHDRLVREIANKAHVAIVFVNYTPSPEAKYPFSLEQAYARNKVGCAKWANHTCKPFASSNCW